MDKITDLKEERRKREYKLQKEIIPEQEVKFDVERAKEIGKYIIIGTIGAITLVGFFKYNAHRDEVMNRALTKQVNISLIDEDTIEPKETIEEVKEDTIVEINDTLSVPNEAPKKTSNMPVTNYITIGDALDIQKLLDRRVASEKELVSYANSITNEKISSRKDVYNENMTEERQNAYVTAAEESGVDVNLLIAMAKQENGLKNISTKYAKGPMQIENPNLKNVYKRYNYKLHDYETVNFGKMNLEDYASNVKAGSIMLYETLKKYDYNMLFAIQAYNYGDGAFDVALKMAKRELGKSEYELTYEEVKPYIKYVHDNPQKLFKNWELSTYGDHLYVENVRRYANGAVALNRIEKDGKIELIVYSWETGKALKRYTCVNVEKQLYRDEENNINFFYNDIINIVNEENNKSVVLNKIEKDGKIEIEVYNSKLGEVLKKYTLVNEKEQIYHDEENNEYFFYKDIVDIANEENKKAKSH